jgi:hypothetical protein
MARVIDDARADKDGVITHVRFKGNERFTSVDRAIPMAERGEIKNVHVVHPTSGKPYLRTNPDGSNANNLDELARD